MSTSSDTTRQTTGRRRLGRGLSSLISTAAPVAVEAPPPQRGGGPDAGEDEAAAGIRIVPADRIRPNPRQPRQDFDEEALRSLGESIRSAGLMQPIVVRPDGAGGYELIVGERRWRAARLVGLDALPAVVRRTDDRTAAEWALIENIQREDLNAMERADAFRRLADEFELTHQEIARRVGLNRSTVSNLLRLHDLDEFSQQAVRKTLLSPAQALVLLGVSNLDARRRLAEMAIRQSWSVRELQRKAEALENSPGPRSKPAPTAAAPHRADLEQRLGEHLGTRVRIEPGRKKGAGRLVIEFYGFDHFDGLMRRLGFESADL